MGPHDEHETIGTDGAVPTTREPDKAAAYRVAATPSP
jgi:hypothetical protein